MTRARLIDTRARAAGAAQPADLASDAWEGAKDKGADLAEDAVDAVRKRPVVAGGVVAALALFLAREPIMDHAAKLLNGRMNPTKPARSASENRSETARTAPARQSRRRK